VGTGAGGKTRGRRGNVVDGRRGTAARAKMGGGEEERGGKFLKFCENRQARRRMLGIGRICVRENRRSGMKSSGQGTAWQLRASL
jgi:hypothetical protein